MRGSSPDRPLDPETWRLLCALQSGVPLSRNRHFDLYQNPNMQQAVKVHRFVESVSRDVSEQADALEVSVVESSTDRFALRLDFPLLHGHRTAYLSPLELRLIAERTPRVAQLISERLDGDLPEHG